MKNKITRGSFLLAFIATLLLSVAPDSQAATVNVFLDNGSVVPGSSNTNWPYANLDRDVAWDVAATAESGLSAIGAAVMEVRMMGIQNGSSRGMTTGGGSGVAVVDGINNAWLDNTEAVLFKLRFYSDLGKTTEITGVDVTFKSIVSRIAAGGTNLAVNAYASSRAFTWGDNAPTGLGDEDHANLDPYFLWVSNDGTASFTSDTGLAPASVPATGHYTIAGTDSVIFGENDTFWLRRENLNGAADAAYQLGAVTFDVKMPVKIPVTVFLDDGTKVPGSSNSGFPYTNFDRDVAWDVAATAESGLSAIGAAVMEVRMMGIQNGSSRGMTTGGGNGVAVVDGINNAWLDNTEAVLFQLRFYSDPGKTTEIEGVEIAFKSIISRIGNGSPELAVNAYAAYRAFTWGDNAPVGFGDEDHANLAPYFLWVSNDGTASYSSDMGLVPSGSTSNSYYTINGTGSVVFDEKDTFWLRRENLNGAADAAYQLGGVVFDLALVSSKASNPNPAVGSLPKGSSTVLGWTSGIGAVEHDVYLGTDLAGITDADSSDATGIYRGRQSSNSYPSGIDASAEGETHYWRIDEVDGNGNIIKGDVWSITIQRDLYSDTWVATDALDRSLPGYAQCGPLRQGKQVGMFYYLWHSDVHIADPYKNITEVLAASVGLPFNDKSWGPVNTVHHTWESEAGYYRTKDEWVIRRHMAMLVDAGVDFLFFDVTNALTYESDYLKVLEVMQAMLADGLKVPKVCFASHANSPHVAQELYHRLYWKNLYQELWFYWDGKPLLLGYPDGLSSDNPQISVTQEVRDFFTWRECWSDDDGQHKWQWQDLTPQDHAWDTSSKFPEQVSVGAAQTPTGGPGGPEPRGRSCADVNNPPAFDADYYMTYAGTEEQGYYFDGQWEQARALDPEIVMITEWNELINTRYIATAGSVELGHYFLDNQIAIGDTYFWGLFNQEFTRDIEPMKGGQTDSYYYQMVDNIRKFKGVEKPAVASTPITISIDGDFSEWANVEPEFRDTIGDTFHRLHAGWIGAGIYTNSTGRNDFMDMKVARDTAYVFFYAKTREPLTNHTDPNWMMLFINADQDHSTGWEGYDFVLNRSPGSGTTTLEQTASGWNWTTVSSAIEYAASGNEIEIRVPRQLIGQGGGFDQVALDFHWADNIQADDDIIEFALSGDSAPNRRFDYRYETPEQVKTTLLYNGFETGDPLAGDWDITTAEAFTDTHSLEGSQGDTAGVSANNVPTDEHDSFRVSFKYMLQGIGDFDDIIVKYYEYDETRWTTIEEIGLTENSIWHQFTDVRHNSGADAKFFDGQIMFHITGGGLNLSGEYVWIDDLEIVGYSSSDQPAPTPEESYAEWAARFGLDPNGSGAMTNDAEYGGLGDGLDNLMEYTLGGNPTIDDAATFMPVFAMSDAGGSNSMEYVYNRRLDAGILGLTYGLNVSTNLLSDWIYAGTAYETDSADIDLYFESVTNTIPATTDEGFISLEIEGDF